MKQQQLWKILLQDCPCHNLLPWIESIVLRPDERLRAAGIKKDENHSGPTLRAGVVCRNRKY